MYLIVQTLIFMGHNAQAIPTAINLGTASSFAVLAGSGITVAGAVNSTTITGNIGTYPTPSITGLGNVVLNGVNHGADAVTQQAQIDALAGYNAILIQSPTTTFTELGGLTLSSGVYNGTSSLGLTGTLTLDGQGNADSIFIFQAGSTLTTATASQITLINGAQACHIFWQIGSSATLGSYSSFAGNILANTSITLDTGAGVEGRLLALNGAVTLDNNTINLAVCNTASGNSVPDSGSSLLLLSLALVAFVPFTRKLSLAKA